MRDRFEGLADQLLSGNVPLEEAVELLERGMIQGALTLVDGNQSAASRKLGIHRNTLQRKMTALGLANGKVRTRRKPLGQESRTRKNRKRTA